MDIVLFLIYGIYLILGAILFYETIGVLECVLKDKEKNFSVGLWALIVLAITLESLVLSVTGVICSLGIF